MGERYVVGGPASRCPTERAVAAGIGVPLQGPAEDRSTRTIDATSVATGDTTHAIVVDTEGDDAGIFTSRCHGEMSPFVFTVICRSVPYSWFAFVTDARGL